MSAIRAPDLTAAGQNRNVVPPFGLGPLQRQAHFHIATAAKIRFPPFVPNAASALLGWQHLMQAFDQ
jgi:hypothetical protein